MCFCRCGCCCSIVLMFYYGILVMWTLDGWALGCVLRFWSALGFSSTDIFMESLMLECTLYSARSVYPLRNDIRRQLRRFSCQGITSSRSCGRPDDHLKGFARTTIHTTIFVVRKIIGLKKDRDDVCFSRIGRCLSDNTSAL